MSIVISKQPKKERNQITIRLDRDVRQDLEHYWRYLGIGARLRYRPAPGVHLSQKDKPFENVVGHAGNGRVPNGAMPQTSPGKAAKRKSQPNAIRERCPSPRRHRIDPPHRRVSALLDFDDDGGNRIVLSRHFPFPDDNAILLLVAA
jgi:hypothetical protein